MPKRSSVQPHLGLDKLEARYRQARDPVETCHYQIIWLLAQGRPTDEVVMVTGYSRSWIYELVMGYDQLCPESIGDHRHTPGVETLLSPQQKVKLWQVLQSKEFHTKSIGLKNSQEQR